LARVTFASWVRLAVALVYFAAIAVAMRMLSTVDDPEGAVSFATIAAIFLVGFERLAEFAVSANVDASSPRCCDDDD
jgi:hypothetical protein